MVCRRMCEWRPFLQWKRLKKRGTAVASLIAVNKPQPEVCCGKRCKSTRRSSATSLGAGRHVSRLRWRSSLCGVAKLRKNRFGPREGRQRDRAPPQREDRMNQMPNVFAWQAGEKWLYCESREMSAPIAVEVERYESEGQIILYWPYKDSATLIWNAEKID